MKRKLWIIVAACIVFLLILLACLVGYGLRQGISISHARYLETLHGHMLIIDGGPVSMSGEDDLFVGLTTGDTVLVAHSPIAESYPGQAKAYLCIKRADGSETDIPADLLQSLTEMGWLADMEMPTPQQPKETVQSEETANGETVTYEYGCVTMSLTLPEGWESRIIETTQTITTYGIEFWPAGCEQTMALCGYPEGVGFCGTGLTFENSTVAGYDASVAWYSENDLKRLEHIYFTDIPGDFVLLNQGLSAYWEHYGKQVMQIAETVQIHVNTISREEALALAEEQFAGEYKSVNLQLDHQNGNWKAVFRGKNHQMLAEITLSADGQIISVAQP